MDKRSIVGGTSTAVVIEEKSIPVIDEQTAPLFNNLSISKDIDIPTYLQETYWWAYVHPAGVRFFERQWLVNLILWGNFSKLRDKAVEEIKSANSKNTLQIACVYGDFTPKVSEVLPQDAVLDVVDVAPVQLKNLSKKLNGQTNVQLHHQDSTNLAFIENSYDNVIVFFLLHEQPADVRLKTIKEALRVIRPGGKLIFVDYHLPTVSNPFRYIMTPILKLLEPFALDMWRNEIADWVPSDIPIAKIQKETYFGGLYQKVIIIKE
ncbi:MAG: class I SAM-dependent methyltransferase [Magnetococcales bacterium]|nr:class I SAM-dependent methyltransferase [Magnetococcales bacterium]